MDLNQDSGINPIDRSAHLSFCVMCLPLSDRHDDSASYALVIFDL